LTTRRLNLTSPALVDIADILAHSAARFGQTAQNRYGALIGQAFIDLRNDPTRPTSSDRRELAPGLRSYHLRHCRHRAPGVLRPRHIVIYDCPTPNELRVLRVLHDAMELQRHLPADF
jgi:toxin ParE1/3/4